MPISKEDLASSDRLFLFFCRKPLAAMLLFLPPFMRMGRVVACWWLVMKKGLSFLSNRPFLPLVRTDGAFPQCLATSQKHFHINDTSLPSVIGAISCELVEFEWTFIKLRMPSLFWDTELVKNQCCQSRSCEQILRSDSFLLLLL